MDEEPKRITEGRLRWWDMQAAFDRGSQRLRVAELVDELRRLRGLIEDGVGDVAFIDDLNDTGGWQRLAAEAEAIRAESGR